MGLTREEQQPDVLYIQPDGSTFVSPDGVGRYYYRSVKDARYEHGVLPQVWLMEPAED